jgi:hypothetical protein
VILQIETVLSAQPTTPCAAIASSAARIRHVGLSASADKRALVRFLVGLAASIQRVTGGIERVTELKGSSASLKSQSASLHDGGGSLT